MGVISSKILAEIVNEQDWAALGLVTPDGRPHNTPVWVHHDNGILYVFSRKSRAKIQYAEKSKECMIAFQWASVRGDVELLFRGGGEYEKIMDLPDARYGNQANYEMYKANWDVVMKITPTKLYR